MKVRVELTVEVDPGVWELIYGTHKDALRQDVREYVKHYVQESAAANEGAILSVESKV